MIKQWLNEYEGLTKFKNDKLYCITGPFVLGIELVKLPRVQKYRPHFVIYSLYGLPSGTTLKECMSYPVIMFELFNTRNLQFSLNFEEEITEVKDSLNNFLTFRIGENISFECFLNWLDEAIDNPNLKSRIRLPEIWEVRYNLALYFSNKIADQVLEEINSSIEKLDEERCFKNYGGREKWYRKLIERDRTEHLRIVEKNKNNKELKSLSCFNFV